MFEMAEKIIWLAALLVVYSLFCLVCGFLGARANKRSDTMFAGDGTTSAWMSASAFTAAALGAWVMLAYPAQIYRGGLPAAHLSAVAIAIPFCALLLFGRLSALGLRADTVSIANLLGEYYRTNTVRNLVIVTGLGFAVLLLALLFHAAGVLLNLVSNDSISVSAAMLALAGLVTLYTAWGGLRAAIAGAAVQYVLMTLGVVLLGIVALYYIGGMAKLSAGLAALAEIDTDQTPAGFSHYLAVPGLAQGVNAAREAIGSPWTGVMSASTVIAFTGLVVSPVLAGWSLGVHTPTPAARTMIISSAIVLGLVLLVFSVTLGLGGHLLGGNLAMSDERGDFVYNVMGANLGGMDLMETVGQENELIPVIIHLLGDTLPWLFALLTVCALAALHATASAVLAGAGTLVACVFGAPKPALSHRLGGIGITIIVSIAALGLAWSQETPSVGFAHLALALGTQMWPAVLGMCWLPRISGRAVAAGLVVGLATAVLTDPIGVDFLGLQVWGGWPLTVHSAVWGLLANMVVVTLVSLMPADPSERDHRMGYHLDRRESMREVEPSLALPTRAGALFLLWLLMAAGPGAVLGTGLFGAPNAPEQWLFGVPSLWVWHGVWWCVGVGLLVYTARTIEAEPKPSHA